MQAEGHDIAEHIPQKYGSKPEQMERNREAIRARGAALGFTFNMEQRSRIYNTLDAHRLLHWAGLEGLQHELKAVFAAYFTHGRNETNDARERGHAVAGNRRRFRAVARE
jgi:predicted DsbA family dithiol-disulfide isomerase